MLQSANETPDEWGKLNRLTSMKDPHLAAGTIKINVVLLGHSSKRGYWNVHVLNGLQV
jgi:hypothetical protein